METTQVHNQGLYTNKITELEFRQIAGLCLRCGTGRQQRDTTDNPIYAEICEQCELMDLTRKRLSISMRRWINKRGRAA